MGFHRQAAPGNDGQRSAHMARHLSIVAATFRAGAAAADSDRLLHGGRNEPVEGRLGPGIASGNLIALGIGFGVLMPRMKGIKAALPEGDAALSGDALTRVQDGVTVTLIRMRAFLALGIVYLMVVKPALITSLAVLFGAVVIGILFSAGAWSKPASK